MRVLMVSSSYPRFPGDVIAPFIEEMAAGVAALGADVHVLLPHHPRLQLHTRRGVTLHSYRLGPFERWGHWGFASSMVADERLRWQAIAVAPPALISLLLTFRSLYRALKPDLAHIHWVVPNGVVVVPRWSFPYVISLHGSDVFLAEVSTAARLVARLALGRASTVTACSSDLATRAIRLGAPRHHLRLLPYGVDETTFYPASDRIDLRRRLGLPLEGILFLAVGRLAKKKGFHVLIEAVAVLKDLSSAQFAVAIAGAGDMLADLRRLAAELQVLDTIKFLGPVERHLLPDLYRAADAYVLPSVRDQRGNVDGLPNVLLEAMATGLPVVASALAGALDVIQDGVNGRLVASGDARALAEAMAEIMKDRASALAMGKAARSFVLENLTWNRVCSQLLDIYRELAKDAICKPMNS